MSQLNLSLILFFRECFRQLSFEIYFVLFVILVLLALSSLHNLDQTTFYDNLKDITNQDYQNYQISIVQRTQYGRRYHLYCRKFNLKRDFNTDYIILGILTKNNIKNTTIPLYQSSWSNNLYFYHNDISYKIT